MSPKKGFTRKELLDDPHLGEDLPPGLFAVEDLDPKQRGLKIEEIATQAGHIALAEEGRKPPEHRQSPVQADLGVVISDTGPKPKPDYIPQPKVPSEPEPINPTHGQIDVWTNPADPVATLAAFKAGQAGQRGSQQ